MSSQLTILPDGITVTLEEGENLLDGIRRADGLRFEAPCNGRGMCGKCRVRIKDGDVLPAGEGEKSRLSDEERTAGWRLACLTVPARDGETVTISLPEKEEKAVVLAEADYHQEVRRALFTAENGPGVGIAVDIGTTTVAAVLLDLTDGRTLARTSAVNPQTHIGGDVLSRIVYTMNEANGLAYCQKLIVDELNAMTQRLLTEAGRPVSELAGYSIAANCTMLHLLLGVDPTPLSRAPFTPVFTEGREMPASAIGLCPENPKAGLYCLPSVSAYIGADIVAGIHMSGIAHTDKNIMFIDIGTNGEIVLSKKGSLYACSCAAGPAMEGMNIACGMRAAEGAVESVSYKDGDLTVGVIGDTDAVGICGSGVLETVAALLRAHAVTTSGRIDMKNTRIPDRMYTREREKGVILVGGDKEIRFSQADVRQIQLAKGAILSGFKALVEKSGLTFDDLDIVMIAGQFGSHLKAETLADIGILPGETRDRVVYIGNSSLAGAISVFLDSSLKAVYEELRQSVDYMELGTYPGYNDLFMACLNFPDPEAV